MQDAFDSLKLELTYPPVLALNDSQETFIVEANASSVAVGPVLLQEQPDRKYILLSNLVEQWTQRRVTTLHASERRLQ